MFEQYKKAYLQLGITFVFWVLLCWQGIVSAAEIWWTNDIFNHGFLIIPASLYLIYLNRDRLLQTEKRHALLPLLFIVPSCLLYVVGVAGDIQLFMHTAAFVMLPSLIWLNLGHRAAKTIAFPLLFMLFSIPVGEQLIPYLQEIAADGSVALLRFTGIPLYRNGLYLDIPQGRFLVAEACSGVSFFIASIVIGFLYTYLNLRSLKKQLFFVLLSFIFPVAANIVRIYGIILIAYHTDMEHAAGADHLIYGWFFFAFVIVCLIAIGEFIRDKVEQKSANGREALEVGVWSTNSKIVSLVAVILMSCVAWTNSIIQVRTSEGIAASSLSFIDQSMRCVGDPIVLGSSFREPDDVLRNSLHIDGECKANVTEAWFNGYSNELVTDLNRAYDQHRWTLLSYKDASFQVGDEALSIRIDTLTSPIGQQVMLVRWYNLGGYVFTDRIHAKLFGTVQVLRGNSPEGKLVIFSMNVENDMDETRFLNVAAELVSKDINHSVSDVD